MSIQITDRISPEIPLQIITPKLVRESVRRAIKGLEDAAEQIIWQIEREAWVTLGYRSWNEMREAEYGGIAFMVPGKQRPEIVERIKAIEVGRTARGGSKHLTNKEIADAIEAKKSEGASISSVALKSGIPRNTFVRKLNGGTDFGVYEVCRIAMALDVDPNDILPSEFALAEAI